MRARVACVAMAAVCGCFAVGLARAESPGGGLTPASHTADARGQFDHVLMVRELMRRRGGDAAAAAQLVQLCRDFSPADAAGAFEELAVAHEAAGNINLAADARLLLAQSYPDEPLARQAMLWLTRVYASSEIAHVQMPPGRTASAEAIQASATYAFHVADGFEGKGGKRSSEPALVFARSVAARRAGLGKAAATLTASLEHARAEDGWRDCAQAEAWLADRRHVTPRKTVVHCPRADEPPRLDGVLDDACWVDMGGSIDDGAKPQAARGADVRWAYDAEYLYVAVRCAKHAGVAYPRDDRPRTRDALLTAFDRVRLLVDVDRDYATWYELAVDSRGWTADACCGDGGAWNPEWFVAAGDAADAWVVEGAIGWTELGVAAPKAGAAWAVAAERVDAGDAKPQLVGPEAFGVFVFE